MKLYSIETGLFKLDGGAMFGVVPKVIWNELNPSDEKKPVHLGYALPFDRRRATTDFN